VGGYASMLAPGSSSVDSLSITENETQPDEKSSAEPYKQKRKPSKKKKSGSSSAIVHTASPTTLVQRARKRSRRLRYANICMFAELLELRDDDITTWSGDDMSMDAYSSLSATASDQRRTLPPDLETGWVALAPIPVGKRCLAVSQQSAVNGTSVGTPRFRSPSSLCISRRFPEELILYYQ
jgi:snurportin-1